MKLSMNTSREIQIQCAVCGETLPAAFDDWYDELKVSPCPSCKKMKTTTDYRDGYQEGYSDAVHDRKEKKWKG